MQKSGLIIGGLMELNAVYRRLTTPSLGRDETQGFQKTRGPRLG
jgi:hypothetical protein